MKTVIEGILLLVAVLVVVVLASYGQHKQPLIFVKVRYDIYVKKEKPKKEKREAKGGSN